MPTTAGQGRIDPARAGQGRRHGHGQGRNDPARAGQGSAGLGGAVDYNVLFVVLDDIGTEWFDWMGVGRQYFENPTDPGATFSYAVTPFLSSLAADGVWFSDMNVALSCGPSRAIFHTGRHAFRTGFTKNIRDAQVAFGPNTTPIHYALPASEMILCEHLRAQRPDYTYGAFGKWHIADGWDHQTASNPPPSDDPPNDNLTHYQTCGFDHQDGNINNIGGQYKWWRVTNGSTLYYDGTIFTEEQYNSAIIADSAIDWIEAQGGDPWFAYVCFGAPHEPFFIPPFSMLSSATITKLDNLGIVEGQQFPNASTYTTTNFPTAWSATMEATDAAIQRIVDSLPADVLGRTMIVVIGDNGTVSNATPPGFTNGKGSTFWGGTRVPCIVKGPLVAHPGRRINAMVHATDIYPTMCDILRAGLPAGVTLDGTSMMPLVQAATPDTKNALHDYLYFQRDFVGTQLWTAYDGRYRAGGIFALTGGVTDELADPLETTNRKTLLPAKYAELRDWKNSIGATGTLPA